MAPPQVRGGYESVIHLNGVCQIGLKVTARGIEDTVEKVNTHSKLIWGLCDLSKVFQLKIKIVIYFGRDPLIS